MEKSFSLSEIKKHFVSEWVLVVNPQTSELLEITGGTVVWHSKDRDEVYRKARELKPKHSAIIYTGELPKDAAVVL